MSKLVIILLFFALIFGIIAGCTGTNAASTTSDQIKPIVGSWNMNSMNITFAKSGQIIASNQLFNDRVIGNWIENQDKTYTATFLNEGESSTATYVYHENTDTLHNQKIIINRIVKTSATLQINPTVTRTKVIITSTPTQDNYQYCRDTYPGSSYNPSNNKCVYPTTVTRTVLITTVPTKTPTQISFLKDPIIGTWRYSDMEMIFYENGKSIYLDDPVTWEKYDDTHYVVFSNSGVYRLVIYDPQLDTLTTKLTGMVFKRV